MKKPQFLIGLGQDSHKFVGQSDTKKLILGGLEIEHPGLSGNSDADVILHALVNAIHQAIGQKSLGSFSDIMCENGITDSKEYLKVALKNMDHHGYYISNVSISLECKTPKIDKISDQIKIPISRILKLPYHLIGITATSGEELTSFGRGEGIQCICNVLLSRKPIPFYKKPMFILAIIVISAYIFGIMHLMNNLDSL